MRATLALVATLLVACSSPVEQEADATSEAAIAETDCSAAKCNLVTYYPGGEVRDGALLPHIACSVSIPACRHRFAELCRTEELRLRCPAEMVLVDQ